MLKISALFMTNSDEHKIYFEWSKSHNKLIWQCNSVKGIHKKNLLYSLAADA